MKKGILTFLVCLGLIAAVPAQVTVETEPSVERITVVKEGVLGCLKSSTQLRSFIEAIIREDKFQINFFIHTGCGLLMHGIPAKVLESGHDWDKIRMTLKDEYMDVYTTPNSIE